MTKQDFSATPLNFQNVNLSLLKLLASIKQENTIYSTVISRKSKNRLMSPDDTPKPMQKLKNVQFVLTVD